MTSAYWPLLLHLAWRIDGDLYGALAGLRALGAQIVRTDTGLRLTSGAIDQIEYDAAKARYLLPHRGALVALLSDATLWKQIDAPGWIDKELPGVRRYWFRHSEGLVISVSEADNGRAAEMVSRA
jgi:hypothetical protein